MLSTALASLSRPLRLSLRSTWIAMTTGTLVYAFLAWTILDYARIDVRVTWFGPYWLWCGAGLSLLAAACSQRLLRRFRSLEHQRQLMNRPLSCPDLARDSYHRVNLRKLRTLNRLPPEEVCLFRLCEPYRRLQMVRMALGELVAIIGLLLGLASGNSLWTLPFVGGSMILLTLAWPNIDGEMDRTRELLFNRPGRLSDTG